jgi:4-amino-4-deoxy-L-arabinose transferase-like glycosyltransferase
VTTAGGRLLPVVLLAVLAAVLVWNAFHYPWRKGFDATAGAHYAEILGREQRLPHRDETDVWHNPPLFYAIAGAVYKANEHAGVLQPGRAVQLLSALCVLGVVALTFLLARELFPASRWIPVLAMFLAALTPVLVRGGSLFHPEPLATLLVTAGLYVLVRGLARGRLGWYPGLAVGALLGLACLTRTWALAAVAAALGGAALRWFWYREPASVRVFAGVAVASALLVVPWLGVKTAVFGSPLAYSQPITEQWLQRGRPASFWLDLSLRDVVTHPYQPWFRNRLVATVYADWWGDYWRTWRVPSPLKDEPDVLPERYDRPLARQSLAGLAITVAIVAGLIGLSVRVVRRRDVAVATLLLSVAFLAIAFAGFLVRYPKQDGDNIKALYVLNAAPVLAIAGAYSLGWLARRGRLGQVASVAVILGLALPTTWFVVLAP